jgi:cation transport ATPase
MRCLMRKMRRHRCCPKRHPAAKKTQGEAGTEQRAPPLLTYRKVVLGLGAAVVATYGGVIAPPDQTVFSFYQALIELSLVGAAVALMAILFVWAAVDIFRRKAGPKHATKMMTLMILGLFLIAALIQLEHLGDGHSVYLQTFATTLVGILIALALDALGLSPVPPRV